MEVALVMDNLAKCCGYLGKKYQDAISLLDQSINVKETSKNWIALAKTLNNKAQLLIAQELYKEALPICKRVNFLLIKHRKRRKRIRNRSRL